MLLFRSLVLGLLGAFLLVEIAHLHTHLHDRSDRESALVLVRRADIEADQAERDTRARPEIRGEVKRPRPSPTPVRRSAPAPSNIDDTVIVDIQRATFDRYWESGTLMAQVRMVPRGHQRGYKLYAIRPNSLFAVIGLQNGDVLTTINNVFVDDEIHHWSSLPTIKSEFFDLGIERAGRPLRIVVLIH